AEKALVDFLKAHKSRLLAHLEERSKPVYSFDLDPALTPVFANVFQNRRLPGRPTTGLFAVQQHVVGAVFEALKTRKGVIIIGEMGVGKSAIGAVLAGALHEKMCPGQIASVMCPPHLVDKWVREIHDAVPGSLAEVVETVDQASTFMGKAEADPKRLHVLVMSRERAKLMEGWEPAYLVRHQHKARWSRGIEPPEQYANQPRIVTIDVLMCPTCGQTITRIEHGEQRPAPLSWLAQQPRRCAKCGSALWQMKRTFSAPAAGEKSPKRNPRYALAEFLRRRYPGRLGLAIIDELHETKSGATDQGQAMQTLVAAADKAIGLTGTLFGGVASSVFWLEWAFNPRMYEQYPIKDGRGTALGRWVEQMGVLEQLIEFKEDKSKAGAYSGKRRIEHRPKEAPGISPYLVRELLDHCVWVGLSDLGFALPEYCEVPVDIALPPQVQNAYGRAKETMSSYLNGCRMEGDASFLGSYLQSLLSYPSSCFRQETVVHRHCRQGQVVRENVVTVIPGFGEETLYPKESWLLETLEQELRAGRRCAVFVRQTGTRDIQARLKELIDKHVGIAKTSILPGSVEARRRDERLKGWVQSGVNVLICNPRLVMTGMDLLDFPTLIFFEIDYSIYVTAQASRRAWRIGQTQECRVYYPFYAGTMEEQAIALVSRKQEAAALLSGNVDGGGLAALNDDSGSSLVAELARVVADDEAVVDLGQLFRKQAERSADFESGWAQAWAKGEKMLVAEKPAPVDAPVTPAPKPVSPVSRRPTLDELRKRHGLKRPANPLPAPSTPNQLPLFAPAAAGGD
ncbi:MAG: hypothetical protein JXB07_09845, partial [Anaerolineae bacterium]|nr:hypothetical protein [Anaerolineae bacterium]